MNGLHVFRDKIAPLLSFNALHALAVALQTDDCRLIQGATTSPPPLPVVLDYPLVGACALTLGGWLGEGLSTVGEAEEYFARLCVAIDERAWFGASKWFLEWFDNTERGEMRRLLMPEVWRAMGERECG